MSDCGMRAKRPIPAVNFHLLLACNMVCAHCFAANLSGRRLPTKDAVKVVRMLSDAGFEKINFAGGEPMLHPGLGDLIRAAKECGMTTSMVTNGATLTERWLDGISPHLDWLAFSIDSARPATHEISGRKTVEGPMPPSKYPELCGAIKERGIRLKINTVVTAHNHQERMAGFILEAQPERWKIMQALYVDGQNDRSARFEVTAEQFRSYIERNTPLDGIAVVPEDNELMTGSYVMVDPEGRFYDNVDGRHRYGRPILQAGVDDALNDVRAYREVFERRGGLYNW